MGWSLNDVELRHLAALRAVAEEGTFARAATRLGFTQSAVSQQIAGLERVVGEPIFDRHGGPRAVTLTPLGHLLLRHATEILDRVRMAEADVVSFRAAETGRFSVGTFQSVSVRLLPRLLALLREERPGVDVDLAEEEDQDRQLTRLNAGELDVAFFVQPIERQGLHVELLGHDPFVVLCPKGSPHVRADGPVRLADLDGVPLIGQHPSSCQTLIESGLRQRGVEPDIVFRTGDNAAVQAMVRSGMGHAVMPLLAIDRHDPTIEVRDLDPPLDPRALVIAWATARTLPPSAEHFVKLARDAAADVIDER